MTKPLVSAIIPTYNRAHLVTQSVDSVLNQTYSNVEIVVVDDGSTDDTQRTLNQYGSRIRVLSQDNRGPASARNRGIAIARGEFVAFLDSDDIWLPTKLERQVALMQKVGTSVPCCLCNIMMQWNVKDRASFDIALLNPPADEGVWINADEVLATRFVLFNQGIMIRREVLHEIGGFDESLRLLEDHEFALRLSLEGPWAFIREPLVIWHETKGSLYHTAKTEEICFKEIQVLQKHLAALQNLGNRRAVEKRVIRELRRARRHLRAAKLTQMSSWGLSAVGHYLRRIEEYRSALLRRSPWFPKMKIVRSIIC